MSDFIKEFNGEFIHINCTLFPITSYMYKDRIILKKETTYDLKGYVTNIIYEMKIGSMNQKLFEDNIDDVLELIIKEQGIVCISLKGEYYEL